MTRNEWLGVAVVAVVAAVVGWFLCQRPDRIVEPEHVLVFPGRTACPDHEPFQVWRRSDSGTVSTIPLPGGSTLIPEFHDCQRLITQQHDFGTLAGIWAAPYLRTIADSTQGGHAAPAAVIHAWDGTYGPLGIAQQWNCLYFFEQAGTRGFAARMVNVAKDSDCVGRIDTLDLPPGTDLNVVAYQFESRDTADYPPVARWDREQNIPFHFIGVGCGAAWCEVYHPRRPHHSSRALSPAAGASLKQRRVLEVKGWYDEQHIAKEAGNKLHPLPFLATLWPDPELEDRTLPDFKGTWLPSGNATLDEHSPEYKTKLNLRRGQPPQNDNGYSVSTIELCWEGESDASPCPGVPAAVQTSCNWDPIADIGKKWYSRITAGTEVKYVCVRRRDHSTMVAGKIPGTARWSWQDNDETQWFRCGQGCCTLKP